MFTLSTDIAINYHQGMKVLADQYLYKLDEYLPAEAELHRFDPAAGFPSDAVYYDALLIRTVTEINPKTLPKPGKLKFIGTATAGIDHVDTEWLKEIGVGFGDAAGCNAIAVGEYVLTGLMKWALEREVNLREKSVCVVGCGHTGGKVISLLNQFEIPNFGYDPPKQDREEGFESVSPDKLLSCDILTFHVPLTKTGVYPTHHLFNKDWLVHPFDLVVNASRGGVVDEEALLMGLKEGALGDMILDVWEGEPVFRDDVAQNAFIATPHIAGYSKESKERASRMVVEQMGHFFGFEIGGVNSISGGKVDEISRGKGVGKFEGEGDEESGEGVYEKIVVEKVGAEEGPPREKPIRLRMAEQIWKESNISYYDRELRRLIGVEDLEKGRSFARLRSETELREEW
jgi:erythronate-4-phosphate dehydrogenase